MPGSRIIATGIYSTFQSSKTVGGPFPQYMRLLTFMRFQRTGAGAPALRQPYLRVVHMEIVSGPTSNAAGSSPFGAHFTPQEEEEFREMAQSEGLYERFAKSIAPSIYGNLGTLTLFMTLRFR